jgi:hypothetical protein
MSRVGDIGLRFDWDDGVVWIKGARLRNAADCDIMIRVLTILRGTMPGGEEPQPRPAAQTEPATPGSGAVVTPASVASVASAGEGSGQVSSPAPETPAAADEKAGETPPAGGAPTPPASPAPRRRRRDLQQEVARAHREHRDWPAVRIAEAIGAEPKHVRRAAARLEIVLPRGRRGPKSTQPSQDGQHDVSAPSVSPGPEPAPETLQTPVSATPAGNGSAVITKRFSVPRGTQFYLQDDSGLYLHQSVTRGRDGKPLMTSDRVYAWRDTQDRLLNVRRVMPEVASFREIIAEKQPARAA